MTLRIGSLCSGYGGLDMAVQQVFGGELAWVADPDPGAAAILKHHHPAVPNLGDITKTNWEDVTRVDLLCGGYPCQPFSDAGLRLGVEDERHIWPYFATAIRVLRPRFVVLENVRGHLGRGFTAVLGDLAALGFDASWQVVRASDVGAPHQRPRLIVVATPADAGGLEPERRGGAGVLGGQAATQSGEGDQRERAGDATRDRGAAPADTGRQGLERARLRRAAPELGRAPADTDDIRRNTGADSSGRGTQQRDVANRTSARGVDWGPYGPAIRRWEHITGRPAPRPTEPGRNGERLSPTFVEWLMGLPAGHVTDVPGLSRNAQLKALGNGVVPQQAIAALNILLERRAAA